MGKLGYVYDKCTLVKVIDGDTLDIEIDLGFDIRKTDRFRLAGIDTPELFKPRCNNEKKLALEAKALVHSILSDRTFKVSTVKDTDKYGRYLADITVDTDVGEINIRSSLLENKLSKIDIDCTICFFRDECEIKDKVTKEIQSLREKGGWYANEL